MKNDIRVESWSQLQDELFRNTWDERLKRHRSSYAYRGLSDDRFKLTTSLMRLGGDYAKLEKHLLRNFKKYAHKDAAPGDSIWNWLAVAQHHGLPTRLFDWTYSPYIALHYATSNLHKYKDDAAIFCVNYVESNRYLPEKLKRIKDEEGSNVFTAEMLDLASNNLEELDALQEESFLVFLEPPSLDQRIINQYSLFSFLSNSELPLESWLQDHPSLFYRIIIPAELKWEIRDKLDQANITERVLFPGLDGLSMWLRRHYAPKS